MTIDIQTFRTFALANMMELEAILSEVYAAHCAGRSGFALFDGGAHRAYHTMRMADLPGCERVYGVEADPFMAETFRGILGDRLAPGRRPQIVVIEKALQDDPAVTSIPWKSSPSHKGRSSIVSDRSDRATIWGDNPEMEYREDMSVAATTIDLVLAAETAPVPFLKLDLEGADLRALAGAGRTLADKRPLVAFENSVHAPKVHGFTLEEKAAYFAGLDYVPLNFVGEPIGPDNWFGFFEAWAAPREDVRWLQDKLAEAIAAHMA